MHRSVINYNPIQMVPNVNSHIIVAVSSRTASYEQSSPETSCHARNAKHVQDLGLSSAADDFSDKHDHEHANCDPVARLEAVQGVMQAESLPGSQGSLSSAA